jgi:hypothetical protein
MSEVLCGLCGVERGLVEGDVIPVPESCAQFS